MSKNLYISAIEARSGKSLVALGIMELIKRNVRKVSFFKPIINIDAESKEVDNEITLISKYYHLDFDYEEMYGVTFQEARSLISSGQNEALLEKVMAKYDALESKSDFVLCLGTDYEGVSSSFEFDINAEIANNLGSPVLIVTNASKKNEQNIIKTCKFAVKSFEEKDCELLALIINRTDPEFAQSIVEQSHIELKGKVDLIYSLPEDELLGSLTMGEVATHLNANILYGHKQLHRHISKILVSAMHLDHYLERVSEGSLIITPSDRLDIIFGNLAALKSQSMPNIAGMVLTGNMESDKNFYKLAEGVSDVFPILKVRTDTFETATSVSHAHSRITPENTRKISVALGRFEASVDTEELRERMLIYSSSKMTPKMFEFGLISWARKHKQHIVLPEGTEKRILQAAEVLINRNVVDITLLGDEDEVAKQISNLGIKLDNINIIDPVMSNHFDEYVKTYYELRKHKGITMDRARDTMSDVSYFGTMMVHMGHADGMVSGADHSTMHTILPSFEIIKTKPDCALVSSVFLMCLKDRVIAYGDCAVNPNPNAEELAEIAISSAETAKIFGVDPKVALLSYSTGASGKGVDVEKVREAAKIAKEKAPHLLLEGPIQYDAAVDPDVAKSKMPESEVAGKATVFIFPDLNTGNNTYKAVQRSAKAVAIGPIMQGMNKPVNDLSRGCLVPDIINTIAITAIQAQALKGLL